MAQNRPRCKTFFHWMDNSLHGSYRKLILIFVGISLAVFIVAWGTRWLLGDSDGYRALLSLINPFDDAESKSLSMRIANSVFACIGSIVFMGILVSTIVNWVEQRRARWQFGEARYRIRGNYSLIIGAHPLIIGLVRQLLQQHPERYIVILTEREAHAVRNELSEVVSVTDRSRLVIYTGSILSLEELSKTRPDHATDIYILGEEEPDTSSAHDNKCLKVFNRLCHSWQKTDKSTPIPTHVLFERSASFKVFLHTDMADSLKSPFQFIPYNYHDLWGQQIFGAMTSRPQSEKIKYRPLDGDKGIRFDDSSYVHLVMIGFDEMARSLCMQAAQLCHFPNFSNGQLGHPRTLITVIDPDALRKSQQFINLYASYFSHTNYRQTDSAGLVTSSWDKDLTDDRLLTDSAWEFISADINSPEVRDYLNLSAESPDSILTAVICQDSADKAVEVAFSLSPEVYSHANQIFVRQDSSEAILSSFNKGVSGSRNSAALSAVVPFGMPEGQLFSDITSSKPAFFIGISYEAAQEMARTIDDIDHDIPSKVFRQFRDDYLRKVFSELQKDENELNWDLPLSPRSGKSFISQRYSNIYHAYSLAYRLRSFDMDDNCGIYFDESAPMLLAETEHNRWITEQLIAGYRTPDDNTQPSHHSMCHADLKRFENLSNKSKTVSFAMSSVAPIAMMASELPHDEFITRIKNIIDHVSQQHPPI